MGRDKDRESSLIKYHQGQSKLNIEIGSEFMTKKIRTG